MRFKVYQQRPPIAVKTGRMSPEGRPIVEWEMNLLHVGYVEAPNGAQAIDKARDALFRSASRKTLAGFPIVEPIAA